MSEREIKVGLQFEYRAQAEAFGFVAGIDEVGRGCLAGPVVAGAVILNLSEFLPKDLNDSKRIPKKKRKIISEEIKKTALTFATAQIESEEIDRINILEATKKAMILAVGKLDPAADFLLVDALELKESLIPQKAIIKGDSVSASIAAASVVAKVYRDNLMKEYDEIYPEYGFANHVGYGTKAHLEALRKYGPTPIHRKSFKGVLSVS